MSSVGCKLLRDGVKICSRDFSTCRGLGEVPTGVGRNLACSLGNTEMQNKVDTYSIVHEIVRRGIKKVLCKYSSFHRPPSSSLSQEDQQTRT